MDSWYEPNFITDEQAVNVRALAEAVEKSFDAKADPHALYLMAVQLRDEAKRLAKMIKADIDREREE